MQIQTNKAYLSHQTTSILIQREVLLIINVPAGHGWKDTGLMSWLVELWVWYSEWDLLRICNRWDAVKSSWSTEIKMGLKSRTWCTFNRLWSMMYWPRQLTLLHKPDSLFPGLSFGIDSKPPSKDQFVTSIRGSTSHWSYTLDCCWQFGIYPEETLSKRKDPVTVPRHFVLWLNYACSSSATFIQPSSQTKWVVGIFFPRWLVVLTSH